MYNVASSTTAYITGKDIQRKDQGDIATFEGAPEGKTATFKRSQRDFQNRQPAPTKRLGAERRVRAPSFGEETRLRVLHTPDQR